MTDVSVLKKAHGDSAVGIYQEYSKNKLSKLDSHMIKSEGIGFKPYYLTRQDKTKENFLTAGIGHKMTEEDLKKYPDENSTIPMEQIIDWYNNDMKKFKNIANKQAKDLGIKDSDFIDSLTSVVYQMGEGWKDKFPSAYKNLKEKKYEDAIKEIVYASGKTMNKKSDWFKQTENRAVDFINAIGNLQSKEGK